MKEIIKLPRELNLFIVGFFSLIVLVLLVSTIKSSREWHKELNTFRKLKVNSKILELKNLNRGNYLLKIVANKDTLEFDLPISYEVEKYNVLTGDSISKRPDTGNFDIFRKTNKVIEHLCNMNIY